MIVVHTVHMHAVSWSLVYQAYHTQLRTSEPIIDSPHYYSIVATLQYIDGTDRECDVEFAKDYRQASMEGLDSCTLVAC